MKDLLSFSPNEHQHLKIGLLVLAAVLFLTNIKPLYEEVSQLSIWQRKPRQAELSPNFKPPVYYEGAWNDLGTVRFVTLDILVLVYQKVGEFEISPVEIGEIHEGVKWAREFFWRNSRLQLNIATTFLEITDSMPTELLDEQGKIWPKSGILEEDLLERGVGKNQYDVVFLFYPHSKSVSGSGMRLKRLGKTAYSFVSLPVAETINVHPDGPRLTWPFSLQLWYSVNAVVYNHDPEEIEDWSALSGTLQQYSIQDPPRAYGKIYLTLDYDRDGVPDDEPMVPFYEVVLGLNRETDDSDEDGLEDKKELTAGIFESADLFLKDTDSDGLEDGEDPYPLEPLR